MNKKTKNTLSGILCICIVLLGSWWVISEVYTDLQSWKYGLVNYDGHKKDFNYCADLLHSMYRKVESTDEDIVSVIFNYSGRTSYIIYCYKDEGRNFEEKVILSSAEHEHFSRVSDSFRSFYENGLGCIRVSKDKVVFATADATGYELIWCAEGSLQKSDGMYYRRIGNGWYHGIKKTY